MRRGAKPEKVKIEAKPTAARESRKNEVSTVRDLEKRLAEALKREAEALEQQTATSEILRVISSSPTDLEAVFDTILAHGTRLCEAQIGLLHLYDGEALRLAAHRGATTAFVEFLSRGPIRPGPSTGSGRVVREQRPIQPRFRKGAES